MFGHSVVVVSFVQKDRRFSEGRFSELGVEKDAILERASSQLPRHTDAQSF